MRHDDVLVLVYTGSYASAVALRERRDAAGVRSSFDDIPFNPHGRPETRIEGPSCLRELRGVDLITSDA